MSFSRKALRKQNSLIPSVSISVSKRMTIILKAYNNYSQERTKSHNKETKLYNKIDYERKSNYFSLIHSPAF